MRPDIKDAIDRYVATGRPLGGFLTSVMENDLMGALARADTDNRRAIHEICLYVYNDIPSTCHGSPAKVAAWYAHFADEAVDDGGHYRGGL